MSKHSTTGTLIRVGAFAMMLGVGELALTAWTSSRRGDALERGEVSHM